MTEDVAKHDRDHEAILRRQSLVVDKALQEQALKIERDLAVRYPGKQKVSAVDLCCLWAVFAFPGLFMAGAGGWGVGRMLIGGVVVVCLGQCWAALCPMDHWFPKSAISFVGLALLISAILSVVIPITVLALIAVVSAPWAAVHIWKVMK
jgi:hypothetical protein